MLLAAAGAATLLPSASAAAGQEKKGSGVNREKPVPSKAAPDSHGARQLFAVVDQYGKLRRGLHAVSARRLDVGVYEVIFNRDVRRGAYLATVGGHYYEGMPAAGMASVVGRATEPRAVVVCVFSASGAFDSGFHLLVVCPEGYA
jgi:hypothetical protein